MGNKLGERFTWMWMDSTGEPAKLVNPVMDTSIPLFLGLDRLPPLPGQSFVHDAVVYRVAHRLEVDHELNPFSVPMIVARIA